MKNKLFLFPILLLVACSSKKIEADFIEIENNNARFEIVNNSEEDIGKIIFEIRYLDSSDGILLLDTVTYQMSTKDQNEPLPFLKANDRTSIVQRAPDQCNRAEIMVLEIDHWVETSQLNTFILPPESKLTSEHWQPKTNSIYNQPCGRKLLGSKRDERHWNSYFG